MIKNYKQIFLISFVLNFIISCDSNKNNKSDWVYLFDGTSTKGWRAYNESEMPPGWKIIDSVLTFKTEQILEQDYSYKGSRDIIYGDEMFDNFELYVEWKIPVGGNSGIFYHVREGYGGPPEVAPEYQLIDDENYASMHDLTEYNTSVGFENPSKLHPLQKTSSDYAMYAADPKLKDLNPAGQWNNSKIIFTETKCRILVERQKSFIICPLVRRMV